jgi:AcrR family transcriptional regulator
MTRQSPSRTERRRNTEERILGAARSIFAERGYERGTIRAIAAAAQIDPALVMQYFGSKQELFTRAVRISAATPPVGQSEDVVEFLLTTLGLKVGGLPETSVAMMRSMLTNPEVAQTARATLGQQVEQLGAVIPEDDPRLRAALIIATMLGVTIGRQLLDIEDLRDASSDRITELLRPCFQVLVGTTDRPDPQD